jgi:hypothetical protein
VSTQVSLPLAKWAHDQQRPFLIELHACDGDGKPIANNDGSAQLTVLFWTAWKEDGTVRASTATNNVGDRIHPVVTVDILFRAVLTALDSGYKYARWTAYTELEARPQTWSDLPLIYKQIKSLTVTPLGVFDALDKDNNVLMTLTPEGAATLRAFNWKF